MLDPDEGFVVTANQAVVGAGLPLLPDRRLGPRLPLPADPRPLADQGKLSVDEMAELQLDTLHPIAADLVPRLLDVDLPRGYYSDGQDAARTGTSTRPPTARAAAYFNVVWRELLALTFHDELPEDFWPDGGDRWMAVVTGLLDEPDDLVVGRPLHCLTIETRDDILATALTEARDEITRLDARNADGWAWGHLHRLDLRNPTLGESGVGPVEWLVNRGGWEVGGGAAAVNATSWQAAEGYDVEFAPSMRMVVSLADLDDSRWINLTGVSGHPFSRHYTDQTDLWAAGETLPWPFSPAAVEDAAEDTLTLEPADPTLVEEGAQRLSRNPVRCRRPVPRFRDGTSSLLNQRVRRSGRCPTA